MGLEDRLREAAQAVEALWTDSQATQYRLVKLRQRLEREGAASTDSVCREPAVILASKVPVAIGQCRQVLGRASSEDETRSAVIMALSLGLAFGANLSVSGPVKLRGEALALSEDCGRGRGAITGGCRIDVQEFQGVDGDDLRAILREMGFLLGEVGIAMVGIACAADDYSTYWSSMEVIDATDEAGDRIVEMLRRLSAHDSAPSDHYVG